MGLRLGRWAIPLLILAVAAVQNLSPQIDGASTSSSFRNGTATAEDGSFEPSWQPRDGSYKPYMGNLTCPFEIAHWNLESFFKPDDLEKRRECGKLGYIPRAGYVAPNATKIFEKLRNGTTIYLMGDSMMCQQGVDLLCLLASVAEVREKRVGRLPPKNWCNGANECEVNFAGFTGWMDASATFRSHGKDLHVVVGIEYGRVGKLRANLQKAKEGDVYVMNQGLHPRKDRGKTFLLNSFIESKGAMDAARGRGARLLWRETTASHFRTGSGYYADAVRGQKATCVPSFMFDREESRNWDDSGIGDWMRAQNVSVLDAWEATFLAPEHCHVGQGKDCLHWLQPGVTSYYSEALLNYLLDEA